MRFVRFVTTVAVLSLAGVSAAHAQQKIAFINSQQLLERAPGRQAAEQQLEREVGGVREQVQRMEDSLTQLITAYRADSARLTDAQRTERETAIRTRQGEYQQRMQAIQSQAQERENELVRPIMDMVKRALDDERAASGYTAIFDLAAQGSPIVSYDRNLDITERVLARLATMRPVATPARPNAGNAPAAGTTPARPAGAPTSQPSGVTRPRPPAR
jgi:outer membrane protein